MISFRTLADYRRPRVLADGGPRFLVIGAFGLMGADVLYWLLQLNGSWEVSGSVGVGWAVFYLACGAAALPH